MSSTDGPVLEETRDGAVAVLTLNEPAKRNALTLALRTALAEAIDRIELDPTIRAVVLTGGLKSFSAGGDLTAMQAEGLGNGRNRLRAMHGIVRAIVKSSKPYIAAVEGAAVGAGFGLALCCDTVIASAEARFIAAFPRVGLVADAGLLLTLPLRVGIGRARQILLYAEPVQAEPALAMGLVDEVVPAGSALDRAIACARKFEALAPLSAAFVKEYLAGGIDAVLDWERSTQASLMQTCDHVEGRTAFLDKRPPRFEGH